MKPGDLVKFSKSHYEDSPGLGYVENWIGIVVETGSTGFHNPIAEVRISWTLPWDATQVSHYDEIWWNSLDYEPFEVLS